MQLVMYISISNDNPNASEASVIVKASAPATKKRLTSGGNQGEKKAKKKI